MIPGHIKCSGRWNRPAQSLTWRCLSGLMQSSGISRARFTKDAFMEEIDFDYLEIYVIEEDDFIL